MAGTRSPARLALLITIGLALVVLGAAYVIGKQGDEFVLLPDRPHPADAIVSVQGEDPRSTNDGPGIYYLDVLVHRATLGETWLAPLESDAERIPAVAFLPPAGSNRDLNRLDRLDVQSSKRLAALVALRALGRKVTVTGGGVRVDEVEPTSPAHAAGLAAGMVVTGVDGSRVGSLTALRAILKPRKPGTPVTLAVLDGTRRRTISTRLTSSPDAPGRALLGIAGEDVAPNVKLPIPVRIDTGNLGGPSAGLAFSLEIYDSLTGRKLSPRPSRRRDGHDRPGGQGRPRRRHQGQDPRRATRRLRPHARTAGRGRRLRAGTPARTCASSACARSPMRSPRCGSSRTLREVVCERG